ncbi:hypothetical protein [Pedobacter nutrimenti]|uniref:hypothetical protein n=1 Tax=Pedobacter nutrimenti TaxID=1241337 RepID=UPI00292CE32B|nr:hypothetical protein [Pedobacter nutrimenti]
METHSEQVENSIFFKQLDICCQKIAEQVTEKPVAEWTNSDYVKLSALLSRKTKVHLSESTLKRIFGKSKTSARYYPQKATRDALAQFIGCRDWYEFELKTPITDGPNLSKPDPVVSVAPAVKKDRSLKKTVLLSILLVCIVVTAILLIRFPHSTEQSAENVHLYCLNPEGQTPHSAIFKLNVKGELPDSMSNFEIDFGDGRLKRSNFRDSLVNHYYEVPGRYYPKLYYKNKVIDTGYVYLQTKGWSVTGSMQYDTTRVYPISNTGTTIEEIPKISEDEIINAGIDNKKTFFIAFTNIKPTNLSGDNFELSTHLTTSKNRAGVRCSQADVTVFGETDYHSFDIMKLECAAFTSYKFSENYKEGKKNDLRELGHDLSNGGDVKLRVENQQINLYVGSKNVLTKPYKKPIGKIMGVKISFSGIGRFDNFQLSDLKTKEKF